MSGYDGTYTITGVLSSTSLLYNDGPLTLLGSNGGTATYNAPQVSDIQTATETGNTVTVTTSEPDSLIAGQQVVIAGVQRLGLQRHLCGYVGPQ